MTEYVYHRKVASSRKTENKRERMKEQKEAGRKNFKSRKLFIPVLSLPFQKQAWYLNLQQSPCPQEGTHTCAKNGGEKLGSSVSSLILWTSYPELLTLKFREEKYSVFNWVFWYLQSNKIWYLQSNKILTHSPSKPCWSSFFAMELTWGFFLPH